MANFSRAILIGNLTRDPELRFSGGGTAVCKFSLAVNRRTKKGDTWEEEVSFFDIVAFGKTAENTAQYLAKGRSVFVEGDLVQRRWEAQDGQKRNKIEIIANTVQFLGAKPEGAGRGPAAPAAGGGDEPPDAPPPLDDDAIPF
jgi:single-strand DNA-binding protein